MACTRCSQKGFNDTDHSKKRSAHYSDKSENQDRQSGSQHYQREGTTHLHQKDLQTHSGGLKKTRVVMKKSMMSDTQKS